MLTCFTVRNNIGLFLLPDDMVGKGDQVSCKLAMPTAMTVAKILMSRVSVKGKGIHMDVSYAREASFATGAIPYFDDPVHLWHDAGSWNLSCMFVLLGPRWTKSPSSIHSDKCNSDNASL